MIEILYNGKYPNLCSGYLVVVIKGKIWDFGKYALSSGGGVDHKTEEKIKGNWLVTFPSGFPKEYKRKVLEKINKEIPKGCCGGCI